MPRRIFASRLRKQKASVIAPMLAATDLGNGEAEIIMYGDVIENEPRDWWTGEPTGELVISSQRFIDELETVRDASHITIRLNSGGGDIFAGVAIHNALKALPATITVHIDGLAASAASVIACAGDEVIVHPGSMFMVHEGYVWMYGWNTPAEIAQVQNQCAAVTQSMANIYVAKTGRTEDEIKEIVANETWFVGQEIIDAGFATALADATGDEQTDDGEVDEVVYDATAQTLTIGGIKHDASLYRNIPQAAKHAASIRLHAADVSPAAVATIQAPPTAAQSKGETFMNATELRTSHPDAVAEIVQQAQAEERARLQAIDEIAPSVPSDLVETAKYREPMSAEQLALAAVKASGKANASFLAALDEDDEDSGAEDVDSDPNSGTEDDQDKEDKEAEEVISQAAKLVNSTIARKAR